MLQFGKLLWSKCLKRKKTDIAILMKGSRFSVRMSMRYIMCIVIYKEIVNRLHQYHTEKDDYK